MRPNESRGSGHGGRFRTTHRSVSLISAQTRVPGSQEALAGLCQLCWDPLKRGGQIEFVPLVFESGKVRHSQGATDSLTAERVFDTHWAMTPLAHTVVRLRRESHALCEALVFSQGSLRP
jgi:hypothetical protein